MPPAERSRVPPEMVRLPEKALATLVSASVPVPILARDSA